MIIIQLDSEQLSGLIQNSVRKVLSETHTKENGNAPEPPDQLLTIKQAGEMLCLSVPTLYGLVQHKEIPVSKRGKRLYFSKQELTDWVKAGRKKTNAEITAEAETYVKRKAR